MKLEDLLKKYVAEASSEAEAKTEAVTKSQEQENSRQKVREEKARGEELNGQSAMKRKKKKAVTDLIVGE